ncbi:hypothetical protein H7J08_00980 [Mycobacterium frederiksbergense]|uniref:hypothetical protein n=1 Tax=Mycolicibacterium frederiksbergense TaxID=117567 RepID=UPI0021F32ED1|nr:hypothetical protein [Mycolicibacterium frederiksbergense]MCV7043251.1 hypothetical protein [Mycolicibacterium frederiksbergense]
MPAVDPAEAAALLPEAARALVTAHTRAISGAADGVDVVARLHRADGEIADAVLDLAVLAVFAGHPLTPVAHAAGIAPATLREHKRRLTEAAA